MKVEWLDRRIARPGPYLTLCLTQEEFDAALKHCKVRSRPDWVSANADATAHHLSNPRGEAVVIVCMRDWETRSGIEVAGLLVHEAVHIWQEYCEMIGEERPGREQEAYAVQSIAQELMAEFKRRCVR